MTTVPLGVQAYNRTYGQEPQVELLNRFFEQTPTNLVEGSVLLARPGSDFEVGAGRGPIRAIDHQPGVFDGDLFFVSGNELFRYDGETVTQINGAIQGTGTPSTTFVAGPGYEHLFISDGLTLQFYDGISAASSTLTSTGAIVSTETLGISLTFYAWTDGDVDAGTPQGTEVDPWLVSLGADVENSLLNMLRAINGSGVPGSTYSTALIRNISVEAVNSTDTTLFVRAIDRGAGGNLIPVVETGANISWSAATLEGGGAQALNGVPTPDDVGVSSLETLNSFVLVAVSNSQRFYWLFPAETEIDPLNFAEAESEPDQLVDIIRVADSVYMLGQTSVEVWYASGDGAAPFIRQQGLAFSQGIIEGSAVQIRTQLISIAEDGKVYQIAGGPQKLSHNGIEERIRLSLAAQA